MTLKIERDATRLASLSVLSREPTREINWSGDRQAAGEKSKPQDLSTPRSHSPSRVWHSAGRFEGSPRVTWSPLSSPSRRRQWNTATWFSDPGSCAMSHTCGEKGKGLHGPSWVQTKVWNGS